MNFKYTTNTPILIDGQNHILRCYEGMTGIGSRKYWIDNNRQVNNCVFQSDDVTVGNHYIYTIKWRDTPWDKIDVIIAESEVPFLLSPENSWREPFKRIFNHPTLQLV